MLRRIKYFVFFTKKRSDFVKKFFDELRGEYKKVVWPSKKEISGFTTLSITLSLAVSIYLFAFDVSFSKLLSYIIG